MSKHKRSTIIGRKGNCNSETDREATHTMIGKMLYAIGLHAHASYNENNTTGVSLNNLYTTASLLFGSSNVSNYDELKISTTFKPGEMLIVTGIDITDPNNGHAWVCDGCYYYVWDRYAKLPNADGFYETYYQGRQSTGKLHFNWGWDGSDNGWYMSLDPYVSASKYSFNTLQYIKIK